MGEPGGSPSESPAARDMSQVPGHVSQVTRSGQGSAVPPADGKGVKRIASLALIFCLGLLVASFAFAGNSKRPPGQTDSSSTSTSASRGGGKGNDKKCHNVSLKGTAPATSFTLTVDRASHAGRDLQSATLTFSGKVNVNAVMCAGDTPGSASTFQLRNLKVAKASQQDDD